MAAFLADENFPLDVVTLPRDSGHDVEAIVQSRIINRGNDDDAVHDSAIRFNRVLMTHDHDFTKIHRRIKTHPGIILCSRYDDHSLLAKRVEQVIDEKIDLCNSLIRVYRPDDPASGQGRGKRRKK